MATASKRTMVGIVLVLTLVVGMAGAWFLFGYGGENTCWIVNGDNKKPFPDVSERECLAKAEDMRKQGAAHVKAVWE